MAATLIMAWALLAVYVVHGQLPANALALPAESAVGPYLPLFMPEGWSFFTRSPREADLMVYVPAADGRWTSALRAPHAEPRNLFGLNRASRAQAVEVGLLVSGVPRQSWNRCTHSTDSCLGRLSPRSVRNGSRAPSLCGRVGVVRRQPVPWAWSRSAGTTIMPGEAVLLEVGC